MKQPAQAQFQQQRAASAHNSIANEQTSFVDNRTSAIAQRKLAQMIVQSPRVVAQRRQIAGITGETAQRQAAEEEAPVQGKFAADAVSVQLVEDAAPKANNTGLPDNLKAGIENLSGIGMDDVKVHYNSAKPAQLQALAYAQGSDIHVGPGQEQHLPHEAWHVVQQKQGRVQPTMQAKGVAINDDQGLEQEADMMGARASQQGMKTVQAKTADAQSQVKNNGGQSLIIQRVVYPTMAAMWAVVEPTQTDVQIRQIIAADPALVQAYADVEAHLAHMDFNYQANAQPVASIAPVVLIGQIYSINYGLRTELHGTYNDLTRYIGAILHEMMHITAALQYDTNTAAGVGHLANMNLPAPVGVVAPADAQFGLTPNQFDDVALGAVAQMDIMSANWDHLSTEANLDRINGDLTPAQRDVINARIDYAKILPDGLAHYDTVLFDILFYLRAEGAQASRSYDYANRMLTEANARRLAAVGPVQAIPRAPLPIPAAPPRTFFQWLVDAIVGVSG